MSDDIELSEYLLKAKENWLLALIGFLAVFGIVLLYTFYSQPVYEAKSLVLVSSQDQANFLLGASAPKPADLETQKIIIQSSGVMYPIYEVYGDDTFDLSLSTIKNSNVIEIVVQTYESGAAAMIANDIAISYQNYAANSRVEDAQQIISFINSQLDNYDAEIQTLDIRQLALKNMTSSDMDDESEIKSLERQMAAKNKILDYLLAKREEATLAANIQGGNVRIIGYADVPDSPLRPNIPLNIVLGFFLAIGGAFGAVMIAPDKGKSRRPRFSKQ